VRSLSQKVLRETENDLVLQRAFFDMYVNVGLASPDLDIVEDNLFFVSNTATGEVYDWVIHPQPADCDSLAELPFYCAFHHATVLSVSEICTKLSSLVKTFKGKSREEVGLNNISLIIVLRLLIRFLLIATKQNLSPEDVK
jgi:hypothetical protein